MARNKPTTYTALQTTSYFMPNMLVTTKATAGAVTYTVNEFLGGIILRDNAGAGRTDTTPTAAAIYNELGDPAVGSTFQLIIRNTTAGAFSTTIQGGSGVTVSGTATIAQNNTKLFIGRIISPTAVTLYSVGTFVH